LIESDKTFNLFRALTAVPLWM